VECLKAARRKKSHLEMGDAGSRSGSEENVTARLGIEIYVGRYGATLSP